MIVAVVLELGALAAVEHVLEGEGMEVEQLAEPLEEGDVLQPLDVDPGDGGGVAVGLELRDRLDLLLDQAVGAVVDDGDAAPVPPPDPRTARSVPGSVPGG